MLSGPDADSLASSIETLLKDSDRRATIGEEGRRWVEEHMDMSVVIDAYARIYQDLAAHGTVKPRNQVRSWTG